MGINSPLTFVKTKVETAIESRMVKQDFRLHLGASIIGHPCRRQIWYSFLWVKERHIEARVSRLFNRGKREEPIIHEDLEAIGVGITAIQEHRTFCFGHGGGSPDGILSNLPDAPKTDHLLEIKTANVRNFTNMKLKGVFSAQPQHYAQIQVYLLLFRLKRALYVMVCKDTDERHYERVELDKTYAKRLLKKAEDIVRSENAPPRIKDDPKYYLCRWCDFSDVCHDGIRPIRNCRTCKNADLENEGVWRCSLTGKKRGYKKQIKGCKKWTVRLGL